MRRKATPARSRFLVALVGVILVVVLTASVMAAPSVRRVTPSADYPLATCVVTGMELHGSKDLRALLVGGTEIQVCCSACETLLRKNPAKYLSRYRSMVH